MLEARLLLAYTLIALIAVVGGVSALLWSRRRKARQRRMRGIKDYTPASGASITR
jgi:hypothetical protein